MSICSGKHMDGYMQEHLCTHSHTVVHVCTSNHNAVHACVYIHTCTPTYLYMCMHTCGPQVCVCDVCACVHTCEEMHTGSHTYMHSPTHVHTQIPYKHIYKCTYINSHAYIHICLCILMHTIYTHKQTCTLSCTFTQVYKHMHTSSPLHTHTHICSPVFPCLYLNKTYLHILKYCGSGNLTLHYSVKVAIDNISLNEHLCVPIKL